MVDLQHGCCPHAKLHASVGVDTIADRDDHVEVVEIQLVIDHAADTSVYDACKFCTRRFFA